MRTDSTPCSLATWVQLKLGQDTTPPEDLEFSEPEVGPGVIIVSWGAPGDDGSVGRATGYDLRYSTSPITEQNFGSCTPLTTGYPECTGSAESATLYGSCGTRYYFGIKAYDNSNNWTALATTSAQVGCGGFGMMAGGGEGGEDVMVTGLGVESSVPAVSAGPTSLLNPALPGNPATDFVRVAVNETAGEVGMHLTQLPGTTTTLDQLRVLAVDHEPGEEVFVTDSGVVAGKRRGVASLLNRPDLAALLGGPTEGVRVEAGDTLLVSLGSGPADRSRAGIAVEAISTRSDRPALGIQVRSPPDAKVRSIAPRAGFSETLVEISADTVRIVFAVPHVVRRISAVDRAPSAPLITPLGLVSAAHSRLGDVAGVLADADSLTGTLLAGDTLRLSFRNVERGDGRVRDFVAVARGTSSRLAGDTEAHDQAPAHLPPRYRLHQNRPNPFSERTTIHFDLAVASETRVEVFDVAGRRVRLLENRRLPAGAHGLEWDRRDGAGHLVSPGIYLYRLQAGAFVARRRMVLLP